MVEVLSRRRITAQLRVGFDNHSCGLNTRFVALFQQLFPQPRFGAAVEAIGDIPLFAQLPVELGDLYQPLLLTHASPLSCGPAHPEGYPGLITYSTRCNDGRGTVRTPPSPHPSPGRERSGLSLPSHRCRRRGARLGPGVLRGTGRPRPWVYTVLTQGLASLGQGSGVSHHRRGHFLIRHDQDTTFTAFYSKFS